MFNSAYLTLSPSPVRVATLTLMTTSVLTSALIPNLTPKAFAQDFEQAESAAPMDEIIVTGTPIGRTVDEAITGVSVLSGSELESRLAATIGETLKYEPGVSSTAFGAGASRPIIRGQGGDRVRVLTNGIGSIDASSASPDHAVAAEPAQAERIEVLRGAALLRYGSSGAGGVVNIIDGRIPDSVPGDGRDGAVRLGVSSVDQGVEAAGSVDQALSDHFVLHLDGTYKRAQDYDLAGPALKTGGASSAEDRLPNSAAQTQSLSAGLSYIGERGFLGGAIHEYASEYGVPDGQIEGQGETVFIELEQSRFDVNGAVELGGFFEKLQVFGGYADYTHTEFEGPGEPGTVFANQGYETRLEAIQAPRKTSAGQWRAAYGLSLRQRDFSAIGDEAFVPPTKTEQAALYSFHELELGELHLEGAARFERTDQQDSTAGLDRRFDLLSVSAGGDKHLTSAIRLGATVFRTERAPTTEELFSNGPHLATGQFERGDRTLGKEVASGLEVALRHREGGHFVTLNGFYTDHSDYIFEQRTAQIEDGLPVFEFTADDATFSGFELHAGSALGRYKGFDMSVDGLAEYVRAKTDAGNLPRIPPLTLLAGLEGKSERFSLRGEIDYSAKASDLAPLEPSTKAATVVNLSAAWFGDGEQAVRIGAALNNVFDENVRQHTSFLKDQVPLPGRNLRLTLSSKF